MKILAVIPARGGSKRLRGKNIRILGGKPLVVWSIDIVKNIPEICDILVSTDDDSIASVSKEAGALVPWLRPTKLATDTASSICVAMHALDWYEANRALVDGILLLQPTSPFRKRQTIQNGLNLFRINNMQTVIGVSPSPAHPMWTLKMVEGKLTPFMNEHGFDVRSQDLPPAYVVNGCFYLSSPEAIRKNRSFTPHLSIPLLVEDSTEALDIDTPWDFSIAEHIAIQRR